MAHRHVHAIVRSIRALRLAAAAALVVALAAPSGAAPIVVPAGLGPGDTYRLAFVTSTTRDATSTDIADYNDFVTTAAVAVPELLALGGTWTAIGSTATVDARDNTGTNPVGDGAGVPVYRLDDTLFASGNADLWDGTVAAGLTVDETGAAVASATPFTGTNDAGAGELLLELGNVSGIGVVVGDVTSTSSSWIDDDLHESFELRRFYAISSVLTVPEPGLAVLVALGGAAVAAARRRPPRVGMKSHSGVSL